jgi:hypothetical protein
MVIVADKRPFILQNLLFFFAVEHAEAALSITTNVAAREERWVPFSLQLQGARASCVWDGWLQFEA